MDGRERRFLVPRGPFSVHRGRRYAAERYKSVPPPNFCPARPICHRPHRLALAIVDAPDLAPSSIAIHELRLYAFRLNFLRCTLCDNDADRVTLCNLCPFVELRPLAKNGVAYD